MIEPIKNPDKLKNRYEIDNFGMVDDTDAITHFLGDKINELIEAVNKLTEKKE